MFYLILKYTFLFAVAALFGFLFGRWWARRSFVDVTHDYVAMSRAAGAPWDRLWTRLDALENSVSEVRSDLPAGLEVVQENLAEPVRQALAEFETSVQGGSRHAVEVDLAPLEQRLASLERVLLEIPQSGGADLRELQSGLSTLSAALTDRGVVDVTPLERRLGEIERSLGSLQLPDLNRWLDVVADAMRSGRQAGSTDQETTDARLTRIEQAVAALSESAQPGSAKQPRTRTVARARKPARRVIGREQTTDTSGRGGGETADLRLLESPRFGSKDDLKRISGIGPKLERLLNHEGVYYYWQVAGWNSAEIEAMDERMEAFRGRIERDDWVSQAGRLMNEDDAAVRPRD